MKESLFVILIALLIIGCSEEPKVVCDDHTATTSTLKYPQMSKFNKIVCDDRGYAYYEVTGPSYQYSLTPILVNHDIGGGRIRLRQVKCEDI